MSSLPWFLILPVLFVEALALAAFLVPRTMRLAAKTGALAEPGGRHAHRLPTPRLGGLAISGAFIGVILVNLLLAWVASPLLERWGSIGPYLKNIPSIAPQLLAVLGGALGMALLGLIDDHKPLGPRLKLAVMILLALPLVLTGVRVQGFLPGAFLGGIVTIGWVVFLANAFNFLDNMDGLCAGVAGVATFVFAMLALASGQWFVAAIFIVLCGTLGGFLLHNFHPARAFMGDNGSLFIGYTIGALSVLTTYYDSGVPTRWPVLTPVIVLGVPIFDTVSVLWIRWRTGHPLMRGDRNHFSHRLTALGMSQPRAVTFIYLVTAIMAVGVIPLRTASPGGAIAVVAQTALVFWIIHRLERTTRKSANNQED